MLPCADAQREQGSGPDYEDFHDIWFEAGPAKVAVIRHGQLVHGTLHVWSASADS